jgi:Uma2 family endonuclease
MSASAKLPLRMSIRDFLSWEPGDGQRYELVDGLPRAMAPAGTIHGFLQGRLAAALTAHLDRTRPSCSVIVTPGVIPRLLSAHNLRVPDLGVTCAPLLPGQATILDPVLLIEILSPSNQADTWSNVWAYTSIPSVQEILVLHSTRIGAEILGRAAEGSWPERTQEVSADGELVLESVGFRLVLAELYLRTGLATERS